ncbi:type II toxin-antitoxin system RelE/ParE family toxin, partial [Candidatus Saccharibacteria bacterium]|nr:type II toxin-antitoxin system RelE/ParE family toxin [Candidatus Saccharibacteria bacterium]
MAYKIEYTNDAAKDRADCVDYLFAKVGGTGNPIVARKFIIELERIENILSSNAEGHPLCEHPKLRKKGYRKIHLRHYKYKVVYYIENDTVFIV